MLHFLFASPLSTKGLIGISHVSIQVFTRYSSPFISHFSPPLSPHCRTRATMVSKSTDSLAKLKKSHEEHALSFKINQLKKLIQAERVASVKEKLEKNGEKLLSHISQVVLSTVTKAVPYLGDNKSGNMLFLRGQNPLSKLSGFAQGLVEKDSANSQEVLFSMSTKLPNIENIPPYTTWIFLDRNQRMAEDQSVVGRRRIYYDQYGSEALICSDSEEESPEPEEEKHEFCEGEDRILWMAFQEYGSSEEVVNLVSQFIGGTTVEIQERYNKLQDKYQEKHDQKGSMQIRTEKNILLDKSLSAALDSFDNLFCRRCLVFDCRLHGCSQNVINPSEKQSSLSEVEEDGKPCSDQCYLQLRVHKILPEGSVINASRVTESTTLDGRDRIPESSNFGEKNWNNSMDIVPDQGCMTQKVITAASEAACGLEVNVKVSNLGTSTMAITHLENLGKRKVLEHINTMLHDSSLFSEDIHDSLGKKQKQLLDSDVIHVPSEVITVMECDTSAKTRHPDKNEHHINVRNEHTTRNSGSVSSDEMRYNFDGESRVVKEVPEKNQSAYSGEQVQQTTGSEWKPIEKDLYLKGVEIFGKNSCLIARNLLSGLKTCIEVSSYMYDGGAAVPRRSSLVPSSYLEDTDAENMEQEMPTRSRLFRRRGRTRKLKYSWKSAGHPSIWKRIADGKNQSCKQYTPCGCQSMCGKQCPCLHNGTCCEKYCGCSKSCKNRFRGCHCAKSQCRSRQCPCFAAGRECDPDVCRNCWVSCGDYSLGEPPRQGDGQCGNMRLFLRQQQKILLAKSDVAGWGAFIKNPVNKNDYLGEYTGELISHREADKRGKIYDRANSSFLFDLNDQYVLDAYRKGDKLKFANHSSNPNCYAKVMLVAGDHRVGIFAKEHIEASEELFYDYRYGPDQAPAWARKPEGSKREELATSHGRAKKHQSH